VNVHNVEGRGSMMKVIMKEKRAFRKDKNFAIWQADLLFFIFYLIIKN